MASNKDDAKKKENEKEKSPSSSFLKLESPPRSVSPDLYPGNFVKKENNLNEKNFNLHDFDEGQYPKRNKKDYAYWYLEKTRFQFSPSPPEPSPPEIIPSKKDPQSPKENNPDKESLKKAQKKKKKEKFK